MARGGVVVMAGSGIDVNTSATLGKWFTRVLLLPISIIWYVPAKGRRCSAAGKEAASLA